MTDRRPLEPGTYCIAAQLRDQPMISVAGDFIEIRPSPTDPGFVRWFYNGATEIDGVVKK